MKKIMLIVLPFVGLLVSGGCSAQDKVVPENKIKESIDVFADLVEAKDLQKFGVKTKAELKSLKPGKQFRNYFIGLDDIKKYQIGQDAQELFTEYPSIEVALIDQNGRIVTTIEFEKDNGNWVATGYGATPEISLLTRVQDSIPKNAIAKGKMIRVPSLHMCFIAVSNHGATDFFMLETYSYLSYQKGQKVRSAKVMEALIPLANKAANNTN